MGQKCRCKDGCHLQIFWRFFGLALTKLALAWGAKLDAWRCNQGLICTEVASGPASPAHQPQTGDCVLQVRHVQLFQTHQLQGMRPSAGLALMATKAAQRLTEAIGRDCLVAPSTEDYRANRQERRSRQSHGGSCSPVAAAAKGGDPAPGDCRGNAGSDQFGRSSQRLFTAQGHETGAHGRRPEGRQLDQSAAKVRKLGAQRAKQEELIADLRLQLETAEKDLKKICQEEEEAKQAHAKVKQQLSCSDNALFPPAAIELLQQRSR